MEQAETIDYRMRSLIQGWGRGRIFFLEDFASLNDPVSVRQFICPLVEEGFIVRLARGIYCYPKLPEGGYSSRMVLPDEEAIAYALAARENVRIIPYGDLAAQRLGLCGMAVSFNKYLTDGSPRTINLSSARKIYFNHTSEVKMFAYRNEKMQMLSSAIRVLGKEYFDTEEMKRRVRAILKEIPEDEYMNDISLPPAWVSEMINNIWNN